MPDDGDYRLDGETKRKLSSVLVTPLQPPFTKPWRHITFMDGTHLALSEEDAARLESLAGKEWAARCVTLSSAGDNKHIRISLGEDEG